MEKPIKKSVIQFKVKNFDCSFTPFANHGLVILHDSIGGFGSIYKCENVDGDIETDLLLGTENDMLILLAKNLSKILGLENTTFIFSFRPEKCSDFETVRSILDEFKAIAGK